MEAWTNSSTGADESLPEGAPSADPAANQVTPPPEPALAASPVAAATPPPEAAVPAPQPLAMVSGEIEAPATEPALPPVTSICAPEQPPEPSVVVAAPAASVVPHARPQPHSSDDPGFSDQIINWMRQGDRLADTRPVEDLDLSDLAEPTDPVAHELLDSRKQSVRPASSGRAGRWLSIGALGVAMSFGLYWAAQEPRPGAGFAAAPSRVVEAAPAPQPPAPAPVTDLAAIQIPQPAANAAHGKHKHHHNTATASAAGRAKRHHGR